MFNRQQYMKKYNREYYQKNRKKHNKQNLEHEHRNMGYWLEEIKQKFGSLSCQECGFDDFRAIQFHHTNGIESKRHKISYLMRRKPTDQRLKELDKIEVLCANCHCIRHSRLTPL